MSPPPLLWLVAFIWTVALELPIYVLFLRRRFKAWWAPCLLTLAVDVVTHPALWYVVPRFEPHEAWLALAEGGVVFVEGVLVALALSRRPSASDVWDAMSSSLAANAFSTEAGLYMLPLFL